MGACLSGIPAPLESGTVGRNTRVELTKNARIAIIGGGPAGSMAGFFLMAMAKRVGVSISVDLYEARNFSRFGPQGCNMCAGVVSESLVQTLAAEGIDLPSKVIQKGIDSYVLHTSNLKPVRIDTPADDLRIATVYRGSGPQEPTGKLLWTSFDGYLLDLAVEQGVRVVPRRVTDLTWEHDRPQVITGKHPGESYDLLIGAVGVNSSLLHKFEALGFGYRAPTVIKGFLSEIHLGEEMVQRYLGNSMHIFLLDIPGLKFAALIPKIEYVTVCLLGEKIDKKLARQFMESPEVRSCFPPDMPWDFEDRICQMGQACHCAPKLNLGPARSPYSDRVVLIGDSVVSRLYKDGIGAAYITAKACAVTALFHGIGAADFKKHYAPVCRRIAYDNKIGNLIFFITLFYQKLRFLRRGMVQMVTQEHDMAYAARRMSRFLWDTFTGSATYREIFIRAFHPVFLVRLLVATLSSIVKPNSGSTDS